MFKEEDDYLEEEELDKEIDVLEEGGPQGNDEGEPEEQAQILDEEATETSVQSSATFNLAFDTNHVLDSSKAKSEFSTRVQDVFQRLGSPQVAKHEEKKKEGTYKNLQEKEWIYDRYLSKPSSDKKSNSNTASVPSHLKDPTKFTHYILEDNEISDSQNAAIALSFLSTITKEKSPTISSEQPKPTRAKLTSEGAFLMEEGVLGPKKLSRKEVSAKKDIQSSKHAKVTLSHLEFEEEEEDTLSKDDEPGMEVLKEEKLKKTNNSSRRFKTSKNT